MKRQMDAKSLLKQKKTELIVLARKCGIKNAASFRKAELAERISAAASEHTPAKTAKKKTKKSKDRSSLKSLSSKKNESFARARPVKTKTHAHVIQDDQDSIDHAFEVPEHAVAVAEPEEGLRERDVQTDSLPSSYNQTKLVVMVRDPYWLYAYWDIDAHMQQQINSQFSLHPGILRSIIRIHDITDISFDGSNSLSQVDVDVDLGAKNWYLFIGEPNRSFVFDLGLINSDGEMFLISRSNIVRTPSDGPSEIVDEKWMAHDFEEIYRASGGHTVGLSSGEILQEKRRAQEQQWVSSGFMSSPSKKAAQKKNDFFLEIGTELILYGRTRPDATLTVDGEQVMLRPDGTFTLRYNLPDSERSIPVRAVSSDTTDSHTITVDIKKDTR